MSHSKSISQDAKKYINYFLQKRGFSTDLSLGEITPQALAAAQSIRGKDRPPAIIIQGVMPRSGTVYVGELLRRHPNLHLNPYEIWEFPGLTLSPHIRNMQSKFFEEYEINRGKIGEHDFLPLVGASLIAYLYQAIPRQKRAAAKMPSVQYLDHFFALFPYENLLILVRDGRDVVHSTLRTWTKLNFIQVCLRWNRSAQAICDSMKRWEAIGQEGYLLAKYETALHLPERFVVEVCRHFNLDKEQYPFDELNQVRIIGSSKLAEKEGEVKWLTHYEKPKDFMPTEYWRNWSPLRQSLFKAIAGRSLQALGYGQEPEWRS